MKREELLEAAKLCVCSDRNLQYGEPEDNFLKIASLWSAYLDTDINSEDVAIMMCLFKVARITSSYYEDKDSWIDLIGYAACGGEIATRE